MCFNGTVFIKQIKLTECEKNIFNLHQSMFTLPSAKNINTK